MQWRQVWGKQGCVWGVMAFSAWLTPVHADVAIQGAGATFPSRVYDRWMARFMADASASVGGLPAAVAGVGGGVGPFDFARVGSTRSGATASSTSA